ncbi:GspH/FimT family protein [uncultured Thalassolituus sp.]|uniref:GspH/FimT family protein n=1 Tax=uncultured Thalassolituus sp. TaxID=285273 RepID=UPI002619C252|nr:GspH/FimT family protein [uncultured Thalassolituus sp.]
MKQSSGFTLIELMVVLVVMGVMAVVAIPRMTSTTSNSAAEASGRLLTLDLGYARNHAQTTGLTVRMIPVSDEYELGWTLQEFDNAGNAGNVVRSRNRLDDRVNVESAEFSTAAPIGFTRDGVLESAGTLAITTTDCSGNRNRNLQLFVSGQIVTTEVACQ